MHKLYIIEDDLTITQQLDHYLSKWGYDVHVAENFSHIMNEFTSFEPSLVLMDISLPHFNGFYWCQEIRKFSKVPIIFISSSNDNMSTIMAINMGADDYISKPFDLTILLAKIQALLRRTYDFKTNLDIIYHQDIRYHRHDATLEYLDTKIELTKNENRILDILFSNKGQIVSREIIMQKLWQTDVFIDENTLTVNITRLRKKLEDIGIQDLIITKKNEGYIIYES